MEFKRKSLFYYINKNRRLCLCNLVSFELQWVEAEMVTTWCFHATMHQLQHGHIWGAVVWPGFQSGHVENMHLFNFLQTPEPQFLDDMLFWRDGMIGEIEHFPKIVQAHSPPRFPKTEKCPWLQFRHILTEWLACAEYTAQYRHVTRTTDSLLFINVLY